MILEEETFKKFGYYPKDLSKGSNKKILAKCDKCGKIFERNFRSLVKSSHNFCEKKCHDEWQSRHRAIKCNWCGKEFEAAPSGNRKFCSPECANKYNTGENSATYKGHIKLICLKCKKEFEVYPYQAKIKQFCSRECSHEYMKGKNSPHYRKVKVICQQCGKEFKVKPYKKETAKFCSRKCRSKSDYKGGYEKSRERREMKLKGREFKSIGFTYSDYIGFFAGHHITKNTIVYIPRIIHEPISHNYYSGKNMIKMGMLSVDFLIGKIDYLGEKF